MKLDGIRVLDLSLFLPGPQLTLMMADHGAEVIKLEPLVRASQTGISARSKTARACSSATRIAGKEHQSQSQRSSAREALLKLAETVDVFVEAFRPELSIAWAWATRRYQHAIPRIIYCSIAAFGQSGPYRELPAHDIGTEGWQGVVSLGLGNDGQPSMPHIPAADFAAALTALGAVSMALFRREKTGRGDYIDISMHDSILACTGNITGDVFALGRAPIVKHERPYGGAAFYKIYRTRDERHVVLAGQEPKFIRNLLNELGRPDLIALCERGPGPHQRPRDRILG